MLLKHILTAVPTLTIVLRYSNLIDFVLTMQYNAISVVNLHPEDCCLPFLRSQVMPGLYTDFRSELLAYRKADRDERGNIVQRWKTKVRELPQTPDANNIAEVNMTLAQASQMIKYAESLNRFENEGILDFLFDYGTMGDLFSSVKDDEIKFAELANYFDILPNHGNYTAGLRIKSAYWVLSTTEKNRICLLFQDAQKVLRKGKKPVFEFVDPIDITLDEALYPIQIQGLGKLANEAVDRVYTANKRGQLPIAQNKGGKFQLAGGGMLSPDRVEKIIEKTLEEHLEEEHANLWLKACTHYDNLDQQKFSKALNILILEEHDDQLPDNVGKSFRESIKKGSDSKLSNSKILSELIKLIDKSLNKETDLTKKTYLHTLRASAQVQTFKLTRLFKEAVEFMTRNSQTELMEQWLEERALGGTQLSHALFLYTVSLENFFAEAFPSYGTQFGDDLRGAKKKNFDLFELIARAPESRFSHIMLEAEYMKQAYEKKHLNFSDVFNQDNYNVARAVMSADEAVAQQINRLFKHLDAPSTSPELAKCISSLIKDVTSAPAIDWTLSGHTADFLDNPKEQEARFRAFVSELEGHSSPRLRTIAKTLLAISAIALAATAAVLLLPGLAGYVGLSAATATNVMAVTTVTSGLLSTVGFLANRPTGEAKLAEDVYAEATKCIPKQ
jgi:hypothetical protein